MVNLGKFQAIIIEKRKQNHTSEILEICYKEIKVASQVKILGLEVNNEKNLFKNLFSNFNYCPLIVWMFASFNPLTKTGNLRKKALTFKLDNYLSSYERVLEKFKNNFQRL